MSSICHMTIVCSISERAALNEVNMWCSRHGDQVFMQINTDRAGGSKVFCDQIWAMAGNYFPWRELVERFRSFSWRLPDSAVLIAHFESNEAVIVRAT